MPIFFLSLDVIVFPTFTFFNSKPPILLTRALLFLLKIDLTKTCNAITVPPPHMGILPKYQEDNKEMQNNS